MTPRERVNTALAHSQPDRTPVDFLAVPEIWHELQKAFRCPTQRLDDTLYFDPAWEEVLRVLQVDCRVLSYDQFCAPPQTAFAEEGMVGRAEQIDPVPHVALEAVRRAFV